jgi:hypothetical protein
MKKPWSICIAALLVFLICTVAGAADKNNSDAQNTRGRNFETARADASPIQRSNGPSQDNDHSRNSMSHDNNARNYDPRGTHGSRNRAMDRAGYSGDRDHNPNIAHNDPQRGHEIVNAPYEYRDSHDHYDHQGTHDQNGHQDMHGHNGHQDMHGHNGHQDMHGQNGHNNTYGHNSHHDNHGHNSHHYDIYGYNWHPGHHHEPGYCNANFEIFCQRKCGDVSPTSCGGHGGFGNHCTPGKLRRCMECGFISER